MVRACDENARREMASHNSLMDPTGKKEEGMTNLVIVGLHHKGNEKKRDGGRRRPGLDILEKRIGKPADGGTYIYIYKIKPP
jgi:hypothetical protein